MRTYTTMGEAVAAAMAHNIRLTRAVVSADNHEHCTTEDCPECERLWEAAEKS